MDHNRARLLVVTADNPLRRQILSAFQARCEVAQAAGLDDAVARARGGDADLILLDTRVPPDPRPAGQPRDSVEEWRQAFPRVLLIAMIGSVEREAIVRAAEAGAYEAWSVAGPFRELELAVSRALDRARLEDEARRLREEKDRCFDPQGLRGSSPALLAALKTIGSAALIDIPILLRGERGTGKEQTARVIHAHSPRRGRAFVGFDCSALPRHLTEEELFGREGRPQAGGARGCRAADGGTLFLDEVGALAATAQARLAGLLETGELEATGGPARGRLDIRLVAGTSTDLRREAREGRFRPDLLRRLSTVIIDLPPLRERKEDIPVLVEHFLERHCRENNLPRRHLSQEALDCLAAHSWKGNVRELDHLIESLVLTTDGTLITARMLPKPLRDLTPAGVLAGVSIPDSGILLEKHVADFERALLAGALERAGGRKTEAARQLGLNRDQMKYLCRKYNL